MLSHVLGDGPWSHVSLAENQGWCGYPGTRSRAQTFLPFIVWIVPRAKQTWASRAQGRRAPVPVLSRPYLFCATPSLKDVRSICQTCTLALYHSGLNGTTAFFGSQRFGGCPRVCGAIEQCDCLGSAQGPQYICSIACQQKHNGFLFISVT